MRRKPGTDTKFPAQSAGNWLSVPGFAPRDMLPVRSPLYLSKNGWSATGGFGDATRSLRMVASSNNSEGTTSETGVAFSSDSNDIIIIPGPFCGGRYCTVRKFGSFDAATISLNAAGFMPTNCRQDGGCQ